MSSERVGGSGFGIELKKKKKKFFFFFFLISFCQVTTFLTVNNQKNLESSCNAAESHCLWLAGSNYVKEREMN